MKTFHASLLVLALFVMTCAPASQASTSYYVTVAGSSHAVRYVPSAGGFSAEIAATNAGVQQDVWYIQQSTGSADQTMLTILSNPTANIVDIRLECTNAVPVINGVQQVFYAGTGQNCEIQFDLK